MVVKMPDVLVSIGVQKALPFTKFLNYGLNKLRESGALQNALAAPKQNCPKSHPIPITFSKMIFLFTVFVLGGTLSIIIFIFERAFSKKGDATMATNDRKQHNMIKRRIPKTNEIGVQCNFGTIQWLQKYWIWQHMF